MEKQIYDFTNLTTFDQINKKINRYVVDIEILNDWDMINDTTKKELLTQLEKESSKVINDLISKL